MAISKLSTLGGLISGQIVAFDKQVKENAVANNTTLGVSAPAKVNTSPYVAPVQNALPSVAAPGGALIAEPTTEPDYTLWMVIGGGTIAIIILGLIAWLILK